MDAKRIKLELRKFSNPKRAEATQRFFKTGKGEYGEGDVFIGVSAPDIRKVAKKYFKEIPLKEIEKTLHSKIHEERVLAVVFLVYRFQKSEEERERIYKLYLKNTKQINNWDLVDISADKIVGAFLEGKNQSLLNKLAQSKNLWERRMSIMSTFHYIKKGNYKETMEIAQKLLSDKHDLIHKAVGWMLREVGLKCSKKELVWFLNKNTKRMPRVMLRYAIEKFSDRERKKYLTLK